MTFTPRVIDSGKIRLRQWQLSDVDALPKACNDPDIARFLGGMPSPYTEQDAHWWVTAGAPASWSAGGAAFAIVDPETDQVLGGTGFGNANSQRSQVEVGYWVAPWARSRGVATTAVNAVAQWAFDLGVARLELLAVKENPASQRVALNAGFAREGVRRNATADRQGARYDLVAFARLSTDPPGPAKRMLPDFPEGKLTDGVIALRRLAPTDVDDYLALSQLPEVARTHIGEPVTRELATTRCNRAEYGWLSGEIAECVIVDAESGAFAGDISLLYRDPFVGQAMLGYSLRPEFRGRGFATRAVRLLSDWAFEQVGVVRVIAGTFPYNEASRAVLNRAGFEREAYFKAALPGADGRRIDDIQFVRISPLVNPS